MNEQADTGSSALKRGRAFDLEERLIAFAVRIVLLAESLPKTRAGNHVANQIIASGTSPAPNYGEALAAESRADFIHKIKIVLKELRETRVWLFLILRIPLIAPSSKLDTLIGENNELIQIFSASVATAQRNRALKNKY